MSFSQKNILKAGKAAFILKAKEENYKKWRKDPMDWLVNRFGEPIESLRWSEWDKEAYSTHEWDGTPEPFEEMCLGLTTHKGVAVESATGTGKTYLASRAIYWFLDCFPNSLVVTTAPKERQLKTILWAEVSSSFSKFKRIRPHAELYDLRLLPDGKRKELKEMNEDELTDMYQAIGITAGVKADEESSTKMQGFHRKDMLFIIEECAGIAHPITTAIKQTCTGTNNRMLAIGNPDSVVDALHGLSELPYFKSITISALDHPNVVLGEELIPGAVTRESIRIRKEEYGEESNMYKSRCRGISPLQSTNSLIHHSWIKQCSPLLDKEARKLPVDNASANGLGVDVANSKNGDKAAVAFGKNNILQYLKEFQCPNANDIAYNLVKTNEEVKEAGREFYDLPKIVDWGIPHECIGVDAVGVGVGTVNEFKSLDIIVQALQGGENKEQIPLDSEDKPLYEFSSLRAQMYWQLRQDLMKKEVILDIGDKTLLDRLVKQLINIKYKTSNKAIVIESKEDIKKRTGGESPNLADVVVYWNWIRKNRGYENFDVPIY